MPAVTDDAQTTAPPTTAPPPGAKTDRIDAFVAVHQQMLWRFLRILGCTGQRADEIAQDTLVIALQRGAQEQPEPRAAAFLRQTARHLWLREQRDDRRRATHHAAAAERLWQREFGDDDGAGWLQALDRCLEQLPERSRTALDRTYRDRVSRAELGAELGIGDHGVRNLLQRLRATLRDCIERRRRS